MQYLDVVKEIATLITSIGVIIGVISKLLDRKLRPLHNQNRMQFRHEIVSFANDLQNGVKKSRDEYLSIYELIDEYTNICNNLKIQNHLFEESLKIINQNYEKLNKK